MNILSIGSSSSSSSTGVAAVVLLMVVFIPSGSAISRAIGPHQQQQDDFIQPEYFEGFPQLSKVSSKGIGISCEFGEDGELVETNGFMHLTIRGQHLKMDKIVCPRFNDQTAFSSTYNIQNELDVYADEISEYKFPSTEGQQAHRSLADPLTGIATTADMRSAVHAFEDTRAITYNVDPTKDYGEALNLPDVVAQDEPAITLLRNMCVLVVDSLSENSGSFENLCGTYLQHVQSNFGHRTWRQLA